MICRDSSHEKFLYSTRSLLTGAIVLLLVNLISVSCSRQEEARTKVDYPQPRFPRYLAKPDKASMLAAARFAVRQPVGRSPLGLVESGQTVHVLLQWGQDLNVWEAIQEAWAERGVEAHPMWVWDVLGISKEEYHKRMDAVAAHGNQAWKELGNFRGEYKKYFPEEIQQQFGEPFTDPYIRTNFLRDYLDQHPEIQRFYAGNGAAGAWAAPIGEHGDKMMGNWAINHDFELLSKAAEFPTDVWNLVEEKILRPRPFVSEVTFQDPEGTNLHWLLNPGQAQYWSARRGSVGDDASNHISIYPSPLHSTFQEGGVLVAHANHTGIFPTMTVRLNNYGGIQSIEGGGHLGELFEVLINLPIFKDAQFPGAPETGYWFFRQDGFATNPKYVKNFTSLIHGSPWLANDTERNRAGVQHLAFAYDSDNPDDLAYAKERGIPIGGSHTSHMHVYFPTVQWRLRDTGEWITISEKGYVKAYDDPEVRALAARYGDPELIFRYEWIPAIPGINVAGDYEADFAQDPWGWIMSEWKQIQEGTYEYFVDDYSLDEQQVLDASRR